MSRINAYSACTFRHGGNKEDVGTCCYETCSTFYGNDNIEQTSCGKTCRKHTSSIPNNNVQSEPYFRQCLMQHEGNLDETIGCCLAHCSDFSCQQRCIDAYNSLQIHSSEPFSLVKSNWWIVFIPVVFFIFWVYNK